MLGKLKRKDKDKAKAAAGAEVVSGKVVLLSVSPLGWAAEIRDTTRPDEPPRTLGGDVLSDEGDGASRLEDALAQAGAALTADPRDAQQITELRVVLDDPAVHYCDTRGELAESRASSTLRVRGQQFLNCSKVTFGFAAFGRSANTGQPLPNGVIAFADLTAVGQYLSRLESLAPKVTALVPLADTLVRALTPPAPDPAAGPAAGPAAEPKPDHVATVTAAIHVGGTATALVVVDPNHGAVLVRQIPVGVMTLVDALVEEMGVSREDARDTLATRAMVTEVNLAADTALAASGASGGASGGAADGLSGGGLVSAADRAIGDVVRQLVDDITEGLFFFETQRLLGRPADITLYGAFDSIKGMAEMLEKGLDLPVRPAPDTALDLFCRQGGEGLNLLENVGGDLTIGKVRYAKSSDGGLEAVKAGGKGRSAENTNATPTAASASQRHRAGRGKGRGGAAARRGGAAAQRGRAGSSGGSLGGLLDSLRAMMRRDDSAPGTADDAQALRDERALFMLLAGLGALLLWQGWQMVGTAATARQTALDSAAAVVAENARLRTQLRNVGGGGFQERVDKVLWTEKFLTLSESMNERMWLSSAYLDAERVRSGRDTIETYKLVMEGGVLPSTAGHINEIAEYIQRLERDKDGFMSDFRDITFGGARLDTREQDPVVRFVIKANYDQTKRIAATQQRQAGSGSLDDTQRVIRDREESMENMMPR